MAQHTQQAALQVLFRLARSDRPATRGTLARQLGMSAGEVARLLAELEGLGWVDADRVRLTLAGLAIAVARPALPRLQPRSRSHRRRAA